MFNLSLYAVFMVALFAIACLFVLLMPDRFLRSRRALTCPETGQPARVKIALGDRIRTLLAGKERVHLSDCARWPERRTCSQECLLQVDLHPPLLERALRGWCEGQDCALCGRALTPGDWRQGRFSAIDRQGKFVPGAEMPLRELPMALQNYRPVCWNCHCTQRELRSTTARTNQERAQAVWAGE
jgi:hypothetical protein